MFGSKIISGTFSSVKDKIKSYCYFIRHFPSWYKSKIVECVNYVVDVKYKVTHLQETNFKLGIEHLYKNNLNDAILRFKLIDKFFAPNDHQANYWLGWVYFLKSNRKKALYHLQKSFEADQVKLGSFLQNYENSSEIPTAIWHQYKNLIAGYYTNKFHNSNIVHLPYSFVNKVMSEMTNIADNYSILELGSNTGLIGFEVRKRFPDNFTFTGVEDSEMMNKLIKIYYANMKIYDQLLEISISDFIRQNSNKYDVVLSFCALSFTKNLAEYFDAIYSMLNKLGYFAFCLPIDAVTSFSLKRREFIVTIADIKKAVDQTKFIILSTGQLDLEKNGKYYIVVCRKDHE